jgi:hypothetical protein
VTVVKARVPSAVRPARRTGSTSLTYTHHAALWSGHPTTDEAAEHVRRTLCLDGVTGLAGSTQLDLSDGPLPMRYRIYADEAKGAAVALFPLDLDDLPTLLAELESILELEAVPEHLGSSEGRAVPRAVEDPGDVLACREDRSVPARRTGSARGEDETGVAVAALALSLCSVLASVALWFFFPTVSSDAVGGLVAVGFASCFAALFGFVAGVLGRHRAAGVIAILVSIVGGILSLLAVAMLGLALALGGLNGAL